MTNSDEFIDEFFHAYDPVKAREYYLRNRKLKGRRRGQKQESGSSSRSRIQEMRTSSRKRREETKARVARFKKRLIRLERVLDQLVEKAKGRSGVSSSKEKSDASSSSSSKSGGSTSSKPRTAAQKRADAKRAKEYREKNPEPKLDTQSKNLAEKIRKVREEIRDMRAQISRAESKRKSN